MSILIDLIVVVLSCVIVYFSAKKGFVRILVQVVGFILAVVIASAISGPLSNEIFDTFIAKSATQNISKTISDSLTIKDSNKIGTAVDDVYASLPKFIQNYLNSTELKKDKVTESVNTFTDGNSRQIAQGIVQVLIKPLVTYLIQAIIFIIILSLLMIAVRVVSKLLNGVKKIPIIGPANSFLGGVLGVLKASLIIYILAIAVRLFIVCTGNANGFLNTVTVSKTLIFNIFYKYNLLSVF